MSPAAAVAVVVVVAVAPAIICLQISLLINEAGSPFINSSTVLATSENSTDTF